MKIIRGRKTSCIDARQLSKMLREYERVHLDIGTGDGRFVQNLAKQNPKTFVIGVDACRENLVKISRSTENNALFAIANAESLPVAMYRIANHVTVNFPWSSLLEGLLTEDSLVLANLITTMRPKARLSIHLNGGALKEQGYKLDDGASRIQHLLKRCGFTMHVASQLSVVELKTFPTTWAKRLAYGRDPRAMRLIGESPIESNAILSRFEADIA